MPMEECVKRSEKRTVCFFSPHATSLFDEEYPGQHGGSELQLFMLGASIAVKPEFDVHFIVNELPRHRTDGTSIRVFERIPHVPRGGGPRGISIFTNLQRTIRTYARPPRDIYVISGWTLILGYLGLYTFLTRRKTVFIVASDMDVDLELLSKRPFEKRLYHLGLHLSNLVMCQNEHQQRMMKELHGIDAKLLRNGLMVPQAPPSARKRHLLWVASCQTLKQPMVYLDLAESIPSEHFVMIMPPRSEPELFEAVRSRAERLDNVTFLDGVHFSEIQRYFDEAKAFVNTSTVEGYPNTFVQSMIGATPIVSLNVDPNGILTEHGLGRWAGGDFDAMVHALRGLLEDEPHRAEIGRHAFEYAKEHHDIKRVADQFVSYVSD